MTSELDHLVVAAATLDDGVRWCKETVGAIPAPGGRHALMGTHNRLLALAGAPRAYLEIIAIDPDAPAPPRRRWFGLDEPALQAALRRDGPRLVHWVARCADSGATRRTLLAAGAPDPGEPVAAARGDYRWRITLRDDGLPQFGGALPALIEWAADSAHPADALPASGLTLKELSAALPAPLVDALGCAALRVAAAGAPPLAAELRRADGGVVRLAAA